MTFVKTNAPGFYRNTESGLVVNESGDYEKIKQLRRKDREIESLKLKINNMSSDIEDIKSLLKQLVISKDG